MIFPLDIVKSINYSVLFSSYMKMYIQGHVPSRTWDFIMEARGASERKILKKV